MNDLRILEAIDDALHAPALCGCGKRLAVVERDNAVWLACPDLDRPSWLRHLLHDRRFVADVRPETHQERAGRLMAA